jgi:hypothetical protein
MHVDLSMFVDIHWISYGLDKKSSLYLFFWIKKLDFLHTDMADVPDVCGLSEELGWQGFWQGRWSQNCQLLLRSRMWLGQATFLWKTTLLCHAFLKSDVFLSRFSEKRRFFVTKATFFVTKATFCVTKATFCVTKATLFVTKATLFVTKSVTLLL